MFEANVNEFRNLLGAKYDELSANTSHRDEIVIELVADEMDRLQQQAVRDMAIRNLDRTSAVLKNIRAALDRLQDEIYGICLRCEQPIPEKRLKAVPWASHCVKCQETIDNSRAHSEKDVDDFDFAA